MPLFDEKGRLITVGRMLEEKQKFAEKFIRDTFERICKALDITPAPKLKFRNIKSAYYDERNNIVYLSKGWLFKGNIDTIRKVLVHELLHSKGLVHDAHGRRFGYYSNFGKDRFSVRVVAWIFGDAPRPKELDLIPWLRERRLEREREREERETELFREAMQEWARRKARERKEMRTTKRW